MLTLCWLEQGVIPLRQHLTHSVHQDGLPNSFKWGGGWIVNVIKPPIFSKLAWEVFSIYFDSMGLWYAEIWHSFGYGITCSRNQGKKVCWGTGSQSPLWQFSHDCFAGFSICNWPPLPSRALLFSSFCSHVYAFFPGTLAIMFHLERSLCGPQCSKKKFSSICRWEGAEAATRVTVLLEQLSTAVIMDISGRKKEVIDLTPNREN